MNAIHSIVNRPLQLVAMPVQEHVGTVAQLVAPTTVPQAQSQVTGSFGVLSENFSLMTDGAVPAFFDLTDLTCGVVQRSTIAAGLVTISTRHTTCAIIVQENEPLLLSDMVRRLRRFADDDEDYAHNDFDVRTVNMCDGECANGHAHCQHLILGSTVTLPVNDCRPTLGLWQRIFLVELDRARLRHYSIQVMGVTSS